jgi:hypothetical protein
VETGFKGFATGTGVAVERGVGLGDGVFTGSALVGVAVGLEVGKTSGVSTTRTGPADISAVSGARLGPAQPAASNRLTPRIKALRKLHFDMVHN